jgi:hypothetical protein
VKTTGFFQNDYTFAISDMPAQFQQHGGAIQANAEAAINYLSDFVSWKGTLDFVVKFAPSDALGGMANGQGLLPSYGGIAPGGRTNAQAEALSGVDANGGDFDAGCYILPNANGSLTNYGSPLYFDPSPDPYEKADIPAGSHDFFSIFLHEVLHAMGFWSVAQHGGQFGQSAFDAQTQLINGQYFFVGDHTEALLGEPLPLATIGSRDHYGAPANGSPGPIEGGLMYEVGRYEQNRWHLGQVDLAVLEDLGYTVANAAALPRFEQPDTYVYQRPGAGGPIFAGNDHFTDTSATEVFNGEDGLDTVHFNGAMSEYLIAPGTLQSRTVTSPAGDQNLLLSIERLAFADGTLAFDTNGNAGQAYRIYQAAFDRTPDSGGVGYWINRIDNGESLTSVANQFIGSAEFKSLYSSNPSVHEFVSQLYLNVLGRQGEAGGQAYWESQLTSGAKSAAEVLADFSESPENVANVAPAIVDGFWYTGP